MQNDVVAGEDRKLAVVDGHLAVDEFAKKHVNVHYAEPADLKRFMGWMTQALT